MQRFEVRAFQAEGAAVQRPMKSHVLSVFKDKVLKQSDPGGKVVGVEVGEREAGARVHRAF